MRDFAPAVARDFRMLYAVAAEGSRISAARFFRMYRDLGAPIRLAQSADVRLFDPRRVAGVFECEEFAFDAVLLRDMLAERLAHAGVEVRLGAHVVSVARGEAGPVIALESGERLVAPLVFNATYGRMNQVARLAGSPPLPVKNELTEVALVRVPDALERVGVTVMDGPFFSIMPFPSRRLHSLTHVRYTPQATWLDGDGPATLLRARSRWLHMKRDAARYVPALEDVVWEGSLYEIKTVLLKNEIDDGRPIFLHPHVERPGFYSVLGGKLDNIYDLFEVLAGVEHSRLGAADMRWLAPDRARVSA
jgi:glycine/D-amino acid oxidase-like deaminating enzyme